MSRRRMIYESLFESDQVSDNSIGGRHLYTGTIAISDDDGIFRASAGYLKSKIFPMDDTLDIGKVKEWRDKLNEVGLIYLYEVNGKEYGCHPNWLNHQNIRADLYKPSRLPLPTGINYPLRSCNEDVTKELPKISKDKESKDKDIDSFHDTVFDLWNSKKIVVHKKMTASMKTKLKALLKDFSKQEIGDAINNYSVVFHSKKTFWTHKWTLDEFLGRNNGARVFVYKTEADFLDSKDGKGKQAKSLEDTSNY